MHSFRLSSRARRTISLVMLLLGPGALAATEPLAPEIVKLPRFVGSWKGELELKEPDKHAQLLSFALDCESGAGGAAVRCTAREKSKEMDIEEASLFGWEPNEQLVHFFAVTNQAETHDHKGRFTDDKTLILEHKGIVGGQPFSEKLSIVLNTTKDLTAEFVGSIDGKEIYRGKIHAKKQG